MNLHKVFASKSRWTQGCNAVSSEGSVVPFTVNTIIDQNKMLAKIAAFSLQGAVSWFFPYERDAERRARVMDGLRRAIKQYTGKNLYVSEFNDDPSTTYDDIKAVLKIYDKLKNRRQN